MNFLQISEKEYINVDNIISIKPNPKGGSRIKMIGSNFELIDINFNDLIASLATCGAQIFKFFKS